MDKLESYLNPQTKEAYHPSIQAAMKLTCKKLNSYYLLTDLSAVYRIAMGKSMILMSFSDADCSYILVLHPGLKLQYFKNHGWEEEWVEMAETLARKKYEQVYEQKAPTDSASDNVSTP